MASSSGGSSCGCHLGAAAACRCRRLPRCQRSMDKAAEAEAPPLPPQMQPRRARSADRYDGLRIGERIRPLPTIMLPRHSNEQPPEYYHQSLPPISPPPTYEAAVSGKADVLPSYEEYLSQNMSRMSTASPPPSWSQATASTSHGQPSNFCSCSKCVNANAHVQRKLRVNLPAQSENQRDLQQKQLRVMLPPEPASSSSHDHCPCSKCQTRYGTYGESNSNDIMFSLDTTAALQGMDGIAFCSLM